MASRASGASSSGALVTRSAVTSAPGGAARSASSAAASRCSPRIATTPSPVSRAGWPRIEPIVDNLLDDLSGHAESGPWTS
jgi:hypothetical protein